MGEQLIVREFKGRAWAWPSIAFAARRPAGRALRVDQPSDCPLAITAAKRYWWVRWAGLGVGAWPMLDVTITNRSAEAVHSFTLRFVARRGRLPSGTGTQPEGGLPPGATVLHTNQEPDTGCVAVCVDFVQFVSGSVWHSGDQQSVVTVAGVQAGALAASIHLRGVLARSDAAAVIAQLARVHADVVEPRTNHKFGPFGFYNGVTNMAVRLQDAFERDGPKGVETLLQSDHVGG
jgi:hypothetical protein